MSIASSSINSKQIIKDSQERLDDEAITALNYKTIKGNQGGLLTTVNEMRGTFYEANDEFYNIVSQYIFLDLNILYSAITQEARVLEKNEIFETFINDYYNERFMTCLNNYYKHSPSFFKTLFPNQLQNINKRNIHQSFQKYYYLLCIIQFTNDNYDDDRMKSLPVNFYNSIVNWCKTRNDPNIVYQLNGPNKNQVITFDFAKHYHSLISVQDTTQDIIDYNKLVRLQNLDDGLFKLFDFIKNMPNVFSKSADMARQYVLHIDSLYLKNKFVDVDGKLIYDISGFDFGDTTHDTTRAHIDEIDRLQTKDITLSKLNIKKLEKIFNMYSRLKIEKLIVDRRTYVNTLNKFKTVYLVFEGIQCSDRTVGSNKHIAFGDLAIPGSFVLDDNDNYEFHPFSEYTTYRPERTRVQKCNIYLSAENNKIIKPYEISVEIDRDHLYNIPLKIVDYDPNKPNENRVNSNNQFPDLIYSSGNKFDAGNDTTYDEFVNQNIVKKTYNGCYLMLTYDNDMTQTTTTFLYDADTNLINTIETTKEISEPALYNFYMHEQQLKTNAYLQTNTTTFQQIADLEDLQNKLTSFEYNNDISNYINLDYTQEILTPSFSYRNHEIIYNDVAYINMLSNVLFTGKNGDTFDIMLTVRHLRNEPKQFVFKMPLIDYEYIIYETGLTNITKPISIVYTIRASNNDKFDMFTAVVDNQLTNGVMLFDIVPITKTTQETIAFQYKQYTTITIEFMLYPTAFDINGGLHLVRTNTEFNASSATQLTGYTNFETNETVVGKIDNPVIYLDTSNPGFAHICIGDDVIASNYAIENSHMYHTYETTNNVLYNPLSCSDFTAQTFTEETLDNNISMITIADDINHQDINVFNFINNGSTSNNFTTTLSNCYVSKSLSDDKTYIDSTPLSYYIANKTIQIADETNTEWYIWSCNKETSIPINTQYLSFVMTSVDDFKTTMLPYTNILLSNNMLANDEQKGAYLTMLFNSIQQITPYNTNVEIVLPTTFDRYTMKAINFKIIVNKHGYNGQMDVMVIFLTEIYLTSMVNYTYNNSLYTNTLVMLFNKNYMLVHLFDDHVVIHDISTNKYTTLINPRVKIMLKLSYLQKNNISMLIPIHIQMRLLPTCHKLSIVDDVLKETMVHTVLPDNIYSYTNYFNNVLINNINIVIGNSQYYKRFTHLYKHIYDLNKYSIFNTDKQLSNYDEVSINKENGKYFIDKQDENNYVLIYNNITNNDISRTITLNKQDMYLSLSWS